MENELEPGYGFMDFVKSYSKYRGDAMINESTQSSENTQSTALGTLIKDIQHKSEQEGLTLCSYFLGMAAQSLNSETQELDESLRRTLETSETKGEAQS